MATRLISIHTTDRILFKRCRRKWGWQSRLRDNLVPRESRPNKNLWLGSGWHWAMEDFHGYQHFPTMKDAFDAYVKAHVDTQRPFEWPELVEWGQGMAEYYPKYWLPRHDDFHTLWLREGETTPRKPGDGIPQLEVDFEMEIPGRTIPFGGTFDGMATDDYGRWWIKEYKTAGRIDTGKLDTDPQVTAYCLAAEEFYHHEIEGVAYYQFLKDLPHEPKVNKDGELSTDKAQKVTYDTYRASVIAKFGGIPARYEEFLDILLETETFEGNRYVRLDRVTRNSTQLQNEWWKLQGETDEMTNPDLVLYPNPTYQCAGMNGCEFKAACLAMDDGSDYQDILQSEFQRRGQDYDWRKRLVYPEAK